MTCLIVHLSDLHIDNSNSDDWSSERAKLVARSAARNGPYSIVLVVLSGDIAFGGQADEYMIAEQFVGVLQSELAAHANCEVKIVVAPGNHDCDFTESSKLRAFARSQRTADTTHDPEMLGKLLEPQVNFRNFEGRMENLGLQERGPIAKSGSVAAEEMRIQIRVWNSALYSEMKEKKGELFLPVELFRAGWNDDSFRVAVMHHPPTWFAEPEAREIRTELRAHAHLILYGHEHFPEIGETTTYLKGRANEAIEADGPVLHAHGTGASTFITFELDGSSAAISAHLHTWANALGRFEAGCLTELGRSGGWMQVPRKSKIFELGDSFRDKLEDPGINIISRSGQRVLLKDLYVPADLAEKRPPPSKVDEIVNSTRLLDENELDGGVIVQGDEKVGKTTLLLRLFAAFHERGDVPIYISLRDHKIKVAQDFQKILKGAVKHIYPNEDENSFAAVAKSNKVFLIDDIDVLLKPELRTALVKFLHAQCGRFLATTTLKTQLTEVLTDDSAGAVGEIRSLRWVKFSYQKRAQLIGLWLKKVEELDDQDAFLSRLDALEKSASVALGHNLVPRVPHMLLIFLHSTSAISPAKLESGALANYYNFLVTRQLLDAGVPPEELEEYVSFARIISFHMHAADKTYVSIEDLHLCNERFAEEFYPGSMHARLNILRNARLLVEFGDGAFQWRHGYFHYLFLGGFLASNGEVQEVRDAIKKMCSHLYVRTNANALLFLVHFTKDRTVFGYLRQVIEGVFREGEPLRLGRDTKEFGEIIRHAKELSIPTDVLGEREKRRAVQDEGDGDKGDGLRDHERKGVATPLEELIVLFKTSEILGQVLKEQYASISRTLREPIVVALLDAYMRAAGTIIKEMTLKRESLHKWLVKRLARENLHLSDQERTEQAQALVADLVQMFMFAFFQKLGESLSSDRTLDLIRHIKWPSTLEVKVFLLACELNLQRSLPLAHIDELLHDAEDDMAFVALIRNLVQVRVSLFHTRAPELQALAKRFSLDVTRLNAIDYREGKSR